MLSDVAQADGVLQLGRLAEVRPGVGRRAENLHHTPEHAVDRVGHLAQGREDRTRVRRRPDGLGQFTEPVAEAGFVRPGRLG
ncbi:hypothetical protein AB0L33_18425 [Streptomyces sp. NPDC052299]|uniref:hypothetical protein n=1 Tax=Streptomyces sp. NPDC052299 TaxID=3155054 RepID=UPI0034137842